MRRGQKTCCPQTRTIAYNGRAARGRGSRKKPWETNTIYTRRVDKNCYYCNLFKSSTRTVTGHASTAVLPVPVPHVSLSPTSLPFVYDDSQVRNQCWTVFHDFERKYCLTARPRRYRREVSERQNIMTHNGYTHFAT